MKEVKVKVIGNIIVIRYAGEEMLYDDDFDDICRYIGSWCEIKGIYINDEEENVLDKVGYHITKELFHKKFSGDHYLPVKISYGRVNDPETEEEYIISLEDNEEFDINKLKLIQSKDECNVFPSLISCEGIMYDGKEIIDEDEIWNDDMVGNEINEYIEDYIEELND